MTTERAGILPYVAESIPCPDLPGLVLSLPMSLAVALACGRGSLLRGEPPAEPGCGPLRGHLGVRIWGQVQGPGGGPGFFEEGLRAADELR
jgi:hypothetical protein